MDEIYQGIIEFQNGITEEQLEQFRVLAGGQKPKAMLITCADSRIDPHLITNSSLGELFILRNAGNIVPPYGNSSGGEAATIEFGIAALKIKHLIVCGHSHCGAMAALVGQADTDALPDVGKWVAHCDATREKLKRQSENYSKSELLDAAVKQNVRDQLARLRDYPVVSKALQEGQLTLHGWVYLIETGTIIRLDPISDEFVTIKEGDL